MITAILSKFAPLLIVLAAGGVGGMFLQHKVFKDAPVQVDYVKIQAIVADQIARMPKPAPAVAIQPFDAQDLKKIRGDFNYSPQYSGNIQVSGVDSLALKRYIEQSVSDAFIRHAGDFKRKRK